MTYGAVPSRAVATERTPAFRLFGGRVRSDSSSPLLGDRKNQHSGFITISLIARTFVPLVLGLIAASFVTLEPRRGGKGVSIGFTPSAQSFRFSATTSRLGDDDSETVVYASDVEGDGSSAGGDGTGEYDEDLLSSMFYDLSSKFECVATAECIASSDRLNLCPYANDDADNTLMTCFDENCPCREAATLKQALLYICNGDELQDSAAFVASEQYTEFFEDTVDAVEAHCVKEQVLADLSSETDETVGDGFCTLVDSAGNGKMDLPNNCIAQEDVLGACDYTANLCGLNSTRVGSYVKSTSTITHEWVAPLYKCTDGNCAWSVDTRSGEVQQYETTCRFKSVIGGVCKTCAQGYKLDATTNSCDTCESGFAMNDAGECVQDALNSDEAISKLKSLLSDESIQSALNMTDEEVSNLDTTYADSQSTITNLGKALRLLKAAKQAELGGIDFWEDWEDDLEDLQNMLSDYINSISNWVSGITDTIEDGAQAVTALTKDLGELATQCADMITEGLETILPTASSISSALSSAFDCDSASLGAKNNLLHPDNKHLLDRKITAIFYGDEAAAKIQPKQKVAPLGSCPSMPGCQTEICYTKTLEDLGLEPEYEIPWPENEALARFAPDAMTLGIQGEFSTCVSVTSFSIDPSFATSVANAFIDAIKPPFEAVIGEISSWADGLTDGIKSASSSIDGVFKTIENTVESIDITGRRLLSEQAHNSALGFRSLKSKSAHRKYAAILNESRIYGEYLHRAKQMELRTRQAMEQMRTLVTSEPTLGGFHEKSAVASLGGGLISPDDIIDALTSVFQGIASSINFNIQLESKVSTVVTFDVSKEEYRTGDFAESLELSQSILKVTSAGPLIIIISGEFNIEMPFYLLADAAGEYAYTIESQDFTVDFGFEEGNPTFDINEDATFTFTPTGATSVTLGLKTGVVVSLVDFQIDICLIGLLCAGPKVSISQPIYFGADVYSGSSVDGTSCFNGKTMLAPTFGSSFTEYPDDLQECALRSGASVAGAGTYVEFPKIDVSAEIVFTINGDTECISPVSLYESDEGDWRDPESTHKCVASDTSAEVITSCESAEARLGRASTRRRASTLGDIEEAACLETCEAFY